MSEDWTIYRFGDLGEIITGRTPPTNNPEYFGSKYPFITPSDMDGKKKASSTERYLSDSGAELLRRNLLPSGSVAVSCIGWQMGKSIMTSFPSFTNQQLNSIIPNKEFVDPEFLYYSLVTRREELLSLGSATGVRTPILNKSAFSNLKVSLPPLPTQRKIAAILSAYDDLIENNTRRIQILEEMAQAIYREWFVHFRFPGHEGVRMVDSGTELGEVPEGWRVERVEKNVNRMPFGKTYKQNDVGDIGIVPVIDQSKSDILGFHNNQPDHVASPENPIIIFGDHTCKMRLMVIPFSLGPNVVPFTSTNNLSTAYLYFLVQNLVETQEYKRHWSELVNKIVCLAPMELAQIFSDIVSPFFDQINLLGKKNHNLRLTRDLLLPRLVSGDIDVSEVEIKGV